MKPRRQLGNPKRTMAQKRAAFMMALVYHPTLDGEGFEIAKRTSGLKEAEMERLIAEERERRLRA